MEIDVVATPPAEVQVDVLAVSVPDPVALSPAGQELDRALEGRLGHLVEDGELKGSRGAVTLVHTIDRLAAHRVAAAGLGAIDKLDADAVRIAAAKTAKRARDVGGKTLAWVIEENALPLPLGDQTRAIVDGVALGPYEPGRWKTTANSKQPLERLVLCGSGAERVAEEARRSGVVAEWTNRCRDLVNTPANELTPEALAGFAEETAARLRALRYEALGPEEIRARGMGALAAVAQGSHNPPRLISLAYEPPEPARPELLLGLVGKAITFDSGGLSIKPARSMEDMKSDMGGGGAVLAALGAIAELEIPIRILAVVAACENMPGGHSYRPGDIVTAANGKTIEVTNTDAEGRLVLADALWHARQSGATHLLDVATLTGGISIAVGDFYAGLFGNDEEWIAGVRAAAEASGDHAWPFPLHETYARFIQSTFADLKNSSNLRLATPIYGARFLQEFVGEGPWAHLDIAGTAYLDRSRGDYYDGPGATGYGVRLMAELARRLAAA